MQLSYQINLTYHLYDLACTLCPNYRTLTKSGIHFTADRAVSSWLERPDVTAWLVVALLHGSGGGARVAEHGPGARPAPGQEDGLPTSDSAGRRRLAVSRVSRGGAGFQWTVSREMVRDRDRFMLPISYCHLDEQFIGLTFQGQSFAYSSFFLSYFDESNSYLDESNSLLQMHFSIRLSFISSRKTSEIRYIHTCML